MSANEATFELKHALMHGTRLLGAIAGELYPTALEKKGEFHERREHIMEGRKRKILKELSGSAAFALRQRGRACRVLCDSRPPPPCLLAKAGSRL
jgi:hypothetical protein